MGELTGTAGLLVWMTEQLSSFLSSANWSEIRHAAASSSSQPRRALRAGTSINGCGCSHRQVDEGGSSLTALLPWAKKKKKKNPSICSRFNVCILIITDSCQWAQCLHMCSDGNTFLLLLFLLRSKIKFDPIFPPRVWLLLLLKILPKKKMTDLCKDMFVVLGWAKVWRQRCTRQNTPGGGLTHNLTRDQRTSDDNPPFS